jgi:hypothetical protein
MNTIGTSFLTDIRDNTCQQYITDLMVASETFLSPKTYVDNARFGFARGIKSDRYPPVQVEVGSVWLSTQADDTLTLQEKSAGEALIAANPVYSAGCSVTNAVKEVYYTITSKVLKNSGH